MYIYVTLLNEYLCELFMQSTLCDFVKCSFLVTLRKYKHVYYDSMKYISGYIL